MRGKRIIKKVLSKTGVLDYRRKIMCREYTKILNLKDCYVNNIYQVKIENGKLISLGDCADIFIKLKKPCNQLNIEYIINHKSEDIELCYPNSNSTYFDPNNIIKIGKADGKKSNKNIVFNYPVKNIRLGLAKTPGVIDIDEINITLSKESGLSTYDAILKNLPNNSKNKKIIVVTHSMNESGAPILAFNISKKFKEKGYDVVVIAISDGYLEEKYRELEIPVVNIHQSLVSERIADLEVFEKIVKTLGEKGYKNVITNTIISGITVPTFKKYDFKIISLIHEMKNSIELFNMKQGGRNINFYSDLIVFPDKIVEDEFYCIFQKNTNNSLICTQGLYKGVQRITPDYDKIYKKYNIPKNSKIILGSGVADYRKGIDLFLSAAQLLTSMEKDEEYHFIWAGKIHDTQLDSWYKCQFDRYGKSNRFHNIDFIKDAKEYQNLVECSDAFWLTSREDPFPSVMIEALQYDTPVLAFKDCGGANTLLGEGRGILIDNFNVVELAKQTDELIKDKARIDKMLQKAQKYINDHLIFDDYISNLEKFFKDIEKKDTDKPKFANVSVVVPNYNYEKYLPIRLESIINQSIKPKEIILLDDVSSDNSIEVSEPILKMAKEKYGIDYKIVRNSTNNGCFRQWLKGIDLAKQDFVWIAEADDYAKPNFIETLMPKFDDKNVVLSYAKSSVIDSNSNLPDYDYNSYVGELDDKKWIKDFVEDGKDFVVKYLSQRNTIPNVSSTIIRKEATNGMDVELSKYNAIGDWFAYIYIISKGKVAYSCSELNGHRRHEKSIIAKEEKNITFVKELLKIKKYVIENFEFDDVTLNNALLEMINNHLNYNLISQNEELTNLYKELIELANSKLKKQNILIILPDLEVGGGQTVGIRLANNFLKYYNVFIINSREQLETAFMKNMIDNNVKLLKYNGDVELLKLYNSLLKFKSVLSFIWWSDKLSYCAFKDDPSVKRIISMHGCYENILDNPGIDPYFGTNVKNMLDSANYIVYTAEKNRRILKECNLENNSKVSKIDNGFILDKYPKKKRSLLGIGEKDFVFGLVARAIPEKGYEQAIEAINIINKRNDKKAHLILVGASEYINELKAKYSNNYIHFIDTFTEPLEWMGWEEIFDVGLLPTYFISESLPTVIVEYLFLNKPVIATDIAEIKSMIVNDKISAGITISLKNGKPNVDELKKAMLELMNDTKKYEELKKNTKEFAKRFDMDKCINKYKKLIDDNDGGEGNE